MTTEATDTQQNARRRKYRKLMFLLVSFSLVLASLICCGQVALLLGSSGRAVDTLSLLKADYSPWGYEKVRPINLVGYKGDIQKDQAREGFAVAVPGEEVEVGVFWPTGIPTPMPVAGITQTQTVTATEEVLIIEETSTVTLAPTITPTPTISGGMPQGSATATTAVTRTPTRTATLAPLPSQTTALQPTRTFTPTPTRTFTYVPQPTRTFTREPEEPSSTPVPPTATFTRTPTHTAQPATRTFTPTPTRTSAPATGTFTPTHTPTHTPTATSIVIPPTFTFTPTPTHTNTPVTPVPTTPIPVPVIPIAEADGLSDEDPGNSSGCVGHFGYINGNPGDIDIPVGGSNSLSAATYYVYTGDPYYHDGLPSRFYPGRYTGIVQVKWEGGTPITWTINGQSATLNWCK